MYTKIWLETERKSAAAAAPGMKPRRNEAVRKCGILYDIYAHHENTVFDVACNIPAIYPSVSGFSRSTQIKIIYQHIAPVMFEMFVAVSCKIAGHNRSRSSCFNINHVTFFDFSLLHGEYSVNSSLSIGNFSNSTSSVVTTLNSPINMAHSYSQSR